MRLMDVRGLQRQPIRNHGIRVTAAAAAINFSLGIVYTWSVFSREHSERMGVE